MVEGDNVSFRGVNKTMKRARPNFDQNIRYSLVLKMCEKYFRGATILEVGGGRGLFNEYLHKNDFEAILTDADFSELNISDKNLSKICCSGTCLPFIDKAVDICLAIDVIEHIQTNFRLKFLQEMARLSRKGVILTCPINPRPLCLLGKVSRLFKVYIDWYEEHDRLGVPTEAEIEAYVKESSLKLLETSHYQRRLSVLLLTTQYILHVPRISMRWLAKIVSRLDFGEYTLKLYCLQKEYARDDIRLGNY